MAIPCVYCGGYTDTTVHDQELLELLIMKAQYRNTLEDVIAVLGERVKKLSPPALEKLRKFGVL